MATDCSLKEFLSHMRMICLYKEVSVMLEAAFTLHIMIGEYMYLIHIIIQNSYLVLLQDLEFISVLDNKRLPALTSECQPSIH